MRKVGRDSGCEIFQIQVGKAWSNSTGGETHSGGLALECTFKAPQGYLSSTPGNLCEPRNITTVLCEHQRKAVICHLLPTPTSVIIDHLSSLRLHLLTVRLAISPSNSVTLFASAARRAGSLLLVQQHCPSSPR